MIQIKHSVHNYFVIIWELFLCIALAAETLQAQFVSLDSMLKKNGQFANGLNIFGIFELLIDCRQVTGLTFSHGILMVIILDVFLLISIIDMDC